MAKLCCRSPSVWHHDHQKKSLGGRSRLGKRHSVRILLTFLSRHLSSKQKFWNGSGAARLPRNAQISESREVTEQLTSFASRTESSWRCSSQTQKCINVLAPFDVATPTLVFTAFLFEDLLPSGCGKKVCHWFLCWKGLASHLQIFKVGHVFGHSFGVSFCRAMTFGVKLEGKVPGTSNVMQICVPLPVRYANRSCVM